MAVEQRIQKIIARSGLTSRRGAEALIRQGRVKLNERLAVLGDKASSDDRVYVDDQEILPVEVALKVLMLNKPEGYISTRKDPQGRKSVFELLPRMPAGRWISVGRLDINTSGLLLFTCDGEIANQLMHPSSNIEREYVCRVFGEVNQHKINRLKKGINLDSNDFAASFKSVIRVSSSGKNHWYKVILMQGRYREVRRLWEAVGCRVSRLKRIRYGPVELPASLNKGEYRYLNAQQLEMLGKFIKVN